MVEAENSINFMPERRLRRFFTDFSIPQIGEKVSLTASETAHLQRTLRLKKGDSCLVTDGSGKEAEAVVAVFHSTGEAELTVRKILSPHKAPSSSISLFVYPALLQKGKLDDLVRQIQELGVDGFFPVETERTIVKMEAQAKTRMAARWEKIVREAAKQSGSLISLKVREPLNLSEALRQIPVEDTVVVFHPDKSAIKFREWVGSLCHPEEGQSPDEGSRSFAALRMTYKACHLFFGPEGGFTEKEMALFESKKTAKVRLVDTLLKADTALLGVVAAVRFLFP